MRLPLLHHIRARLTLWSILVFGGILGLYTIGASWFFLYSLNHQLEAALKEDVELVEQLLLQNPQGSYELDTHAEATGKLERFLEIWAEDGTLLYRSATLGGRPLGDAPLANEKTTNIHIGSVLFQDGTRLRVASKFSPYGGQPKFIRLGVSEAEYFADIQNFIVMLFIGVPLGLVLVSMSSYLMARRALKPIDIMATTARRISAEDLKDRIPVINQNDELGRLAQAFNELLDRMQQSFEQLRRFTSDASHELRTPLTAMRSVGEVALQSTRTPQEYREVIGSMLEESSRLTRLIEGLLFLSRGESKKHLLHREPLDLLAFVQTTANVMSVLAEEKEQRLEIESTAGVLQYADRLLLGQAVLNLVDNAIKFSPPRSKITVTVSRNNATQDCIAVTDEGPGIPPSEQELIFERFYRGNKDGAGGAGLGLAIARWAVEAHGGTLRVESREGAGATFLISLPHQSPSQAAGKQES